MGQRRNKKIKLENILRQKLKHNLPKLMIYSKSGAKRGVYAGKCLHFFKRSPA